jgi:hypothetical protein
MISENNIIYDIIVFMIFPDGDFSLGLFTGTFHWDFRAYDIMYDIIVLQVYDIIYDIIVFMIYMPRVYDIIYMPRVYDIIYDIIAVYDI